MLTIKCAKCKTKIMKYKKIGGGKVLRCYKKMIKRVYDGVVNEDKLKCENCGNIIGKIKSKHVKMIGKAFTYTGTKINK